MADYELRMRREGQTESGVYRFSGSETAALRREIESLQLALAASKRLRDGEMAAIRERLQADFPESSKTSMLAEAETRLHTAMREYEEVTQLSAALRREFLSQKAENSEEVSDFETRDRRLQLELDLLKSQALAKAQHDIDTAREELQRLAADVEVRRRVMKTEADAEEKEWRDRVAAREALVRNLENEVLALGEQLKRTADSGAKSIEDMRGTLQTLESIAESQKKDLQRVAVSRLTARKSAQSLAKRALQLDREMQAVKDESRLLHSSSAKLGKIVYGKGTKLRT